MAWILLTTGLLLIAAYCFGRSAPRRSAQGGLLSPVTQQHLHLFQGGRLSETAVATAKATLGGFLARGDRERAEACFRRGLHYAVQVQALAEIGGASAAELLHRQLQRRLCDDPIEQNWYWIDVAHGLRRVQRAESLPHLLRCPANEAAAPLGQFFAAEAVCCAGFAEELGHPTGPLGRAALRMLFATLRGLRHGVAPQVIADARLGDAVATLWNNRPDRADPGVVRILVEALRLAQRSDHYFQAQRDQPRRVEGLTRQVRELRKRADVFADYLADAPGQLLADLAAAGDGGRAEMLAALDDLRADAAAVVVPRLRDWPADHRDLAVRLLRWSTDRDAVRWLCAWADGTVRPARRARRPAQTGAPHRPSVPLGFPYRSLLYSLRGHPTERSEALLLLAARDWDPTIRAAAVGSLGWWDPLAQNDVRCTLSRAREDGNGDVCRAAEAALARLGERRAVQLFRRWLVGDSDTGVPDAIRFIAGERLYWLWPELDALADADDSEAAMAAREALEQMREELAGGMLVR